MSPLPRRPPSRVRPTLLPSRRPGPRAVAVLRPRAAAVGVAALLLAGCAAADDGAATGAPDAAPTPPATGSPGTATGPDAATATEAVRTERITVQDGRVDPPPGQLDLAVGERLRLLVTADQGESVHAHGFDDLEVPVTPGEPVAVDLVGEDPGLYEVELHHPDLLLAQVAVR